MVVPTITITRVGHGPALKARALNKVKRASLWEVADQWHIRFRPIHFTTKGARIYGYRARRTKYIRTGQVRKSKSGRPKAPSGLPLVWSGRTRILSLQKRIRATSKRSRVSSPVRALNFKPRGFPPGQMAREYTTVVQGEKVKLQSVATQKAARELRGTRVKTVVRI